MPLKSVNRLPHILYFSASRCISDTISKGRKCPPMALNGKVKPCPLHSHPVQAGCEFIAKLLIFCFAVKSRCRRFLRLSVNRSHILQGFARCGFQRSARCDCLGGVLLGSLPFRLALLPCTIYARKKRKSYTKRKKILKNFCIDFKAF